MSRAIRRHHVKRIKYKVSKFLSLQGWLSICNNRQRAIGISSHSKTLCSCTMCGNPRKHFGHRKLNELIHIETLKEYIFTSEEDSIIIL